MPAVNNALQQPASLPSAIYGDDEPVLAGIPVREDADRAQFPRFGDDHWDLGAAIFRVNARYSNYWLNFARIVDPVIRRLAKEYVLARLRVHVPGYRAPCGVASAIRLLRYIQHFAAFLTAHIGAVDLHRIDQSLLDSYLAHARDGGRRTPHETVKSEIVGKRHWVSEEQFALSFALGRLTPGTNLLAFCVGIGWILRRGAGAVVALLASSVPCTLIVVAITVLFTRWQENPFVQAGIKGAIAAAIAVTVKTVWTIAHPHFRAGSRVRVVLIGAAAFALHVFAGISPINVLLLAALIGFFLPEPS